MAEKTCEAEWWEYTGVWRCKHCKQILHEGSKTAIKEALDLAKIIICGGLTG